MHLRKTWFHGSIGQIFHMPPGTSYGNAFPGVTKQ